MLSTAEYELFAMNQQDKVAVMEIQYQLVNEGGGLISSFINFITGLIKRVVDFITSPFKKKAISNVDDNDNAKAFKSEVKVPILDPDKTLDIAKQMIHDATTLSQKIMSQDFNDTDKTLYDKIAAEVNTDGAITKKLQGTMPGMANGKIYATKTLNIVEVCDISNKIQDCKNKLVEISKPAQKSMEAAKNKVNQISNEEKQKKFIGIQTVLSRYLTIAVSFPNSLFDACIKMCNEAGASIKKDFEEKNPGREMHIQYASTSQDEENKPEENNKPNEGQIRNNKNKNNKNKKR